MTPDEINQNYRETVSAIPGEPFTAEWCKAAEKASNVSRESFLANDEVAVRVIETADGAVTIAKGANICKGCNEVIPPTGMRGRPASFHEECRPKKGA